MIEIPLVGGRVARVDDADLPLVKSFKWYCDKRDGICYATNGVQRMHRLIMDAPSDAIVDHIDGDGLNNQRANLRLCNKSQNGANMRKRPGSSRFKGVSKYEGRWRALIRVNYRRRIVGIFENEADAALAYDRAATEAFGQFARLNFPAVRPQAAP